MGAPVAVAGRYIAEAPWMWGMSIRQAGPSPPPPPLEHLLWRVTKTRGMPRLACAGCPREKNCRVSVGDQLVVSRLFRDDEGGRKLGVESEGTLGTSSRTDGRRTSVPDRL